MRKLAILSVVLSASIIFLSCSKAKEDDGLISGTVWTMDTNEMSMELSFIDDSNCTMRTGGKGGYYANFTTYKYAIGYCTGIFIYSEFPDGEKIYEYTCNRVDRKNMTVRYKAIEDGFSDEELAFKRKK